jgi:membrane-associated protease RseP (regulator of RpoE activity)
MKNLSSLFMLAIILAFGMQTVSLKAQDKKAKQARIKIIKIENGKTIEIDTVIELTDDADINTIFDKSGVGSELEIIDSDGNMEIIIKKTEEEGDERTYKIIVNEDKVKWGEGGSKAFLGIYMKQAETEGVIIENVVENSAAEKAGLQPGDILITIDGEKITDSESVYEALKNKKPGDEVSLEYLRDGKKQSAKATLGERKNEMRSYMFNGDEDFDFDFDMDEMGKMKGHAFMWKEMKDRPFLGVGIEDAAEMEDSKSDKGVYVNKIYENSAAEQAGMKPGDIIIKIDEKAIEKSEQLIDALKEHKAGESIKLTYLRDGNQMEKTIELKAREINEDFEMGMPHIMMKMGDMDGHMNEIKENLQEIQDEIQKIENDELKIKLEEKLKALQEKLKGRQGMIMEKMGKFENMAEVKCIKMMKGMDNSFVRITIEIEDVSDEEASQLKINNTNDLSIDELTFSPNPGDGHFQLSFTLPEEGKTTIRVFDMQGNEIYKEKLNRFSGNYNGTLDISEQAKGVYFLNVEQNGKSISKKMIIQ